MKEAISMYFGGEIISAADCDYQTSRELGLKCPFCNSAVFVRSESVRQIKGRFQLVSPYFAHYPSGAPDNWDCEKRSHTKQGREEIERIRIQARNQRLRLYNAYLWQMIADDRNISHQKLNKVRSDFGEKWCEETSILVRWEWKNSLDSVYTYMDEALQAIVAASDVTRQTKHKYGDLGSLLIEEAASQQTWLMQADRRLHSAICQEVAEFLGTDTAGFAFHKILKACLYISLQIYVRDVRPKSMTDWVRAVREVKQLEPRSHVPTIAGFLAGTHWVEAIQKRIGKDN